MLRKHFCNGLLALLGIATPLFVAACSGVSVRADRASRLNLAEYETYAFMDSSDETGRWQNASRRRSRTR